MTGFGFCGSFCTLSESLNEMGALIDKGREIQPIFSYSVCETDTRFYLAKNFKAEVEEKCRRPVIATIVDAEPLGPSIPLKAMIIAPCTGNTLAKIANGISDTPVTMAAKAHLRSDRPLVIALASNDALSANLKNIADLLERKCVFFVPLGQDDPIKKPHSLVAKFSLIEKTLEKALWGKQLQPLLIQH